MVLVLKNSIFRTFSFQGVGGGVGWDEGGVGEGTRDD